MKKSNRKDNALIKRKNLLNLLKKSGIQRVSRDALNSLENHISDYLIKSIPKLKESMEINGRKTLKRRDTEVLKESKKKNYLEI